MYMCESENIQPLSRASVNLSKIVIFSIIYTYTLNFKKVVSFN